MARQGAVLIGKEATPTLEVFRSGKTSVVSVGTSAVALPTTNLSNRKAIVIQNIHASQAVYLGMCVPDIIVNRLSPNEAGSGTRKYLKWKKSGGGTNEWYAVTNAGGDPGLGLSSNAVLYYATVGGGSETAATNGTVGALAAEHGWGWGDGDTLGYSTLYVRTGAGTAGYEPDQRYDLILVYATMPDTSTNYGIKINSGGGVFEATIDGSARVFGIASGAATTTTILELAVTEDSDGNFH